MAGQKRKWNDLNLWNDLGDRENDSGIDNATRAEEIIDNEHDLDEIEDKENLAGSKSRNGSKTEKSTKKVVKNVGGASRLEWFNEFVNRPSLEAIRKNLFRKISNTKTMDEEPRCIQVAGFTNETRPVIDKNILQDASGDLPPGFPTRFSPYVIALAKAKKLLPDRDPPRLPTEHRQVTHKRVKLAQNGNEKDATWVASHLCHNSSCVNPLHIEWEPSWFNRLRDNCLGGEHCVHRPRCLKSHRPAAVLNWRDYW